MLGAQEPINASDAKQSDWSPPMPIGPHTQHEDAAPHLEALEEVVHLLGRQVIAQGGELAAQGAAATQLACSPPYPMPEPSGPLLSICWCRH